MIDTKTLDAAFGRVLPDVAALLREGDVIAVDGKARRGARDVGESARTRMMVSIYAARLRLKLASVPANRGAELEAAIEALGLIASTGSSRTASTGSSTCRSANTPHATGRITARATLPSCAAASSMSCAEGHVEGASLQQAQASRMGQRPPSKRSQWLRGRYQPYAIALAIGGWPRTGRSCLFCSPSATCYKCDNGCWHEDESVRNRQIRRLGGQNSPEAAEDEPSKGANNPQAGASALAKPLIRHSQTTPLETGGKPRDRAYANHTSCASPRTDRYLCV